MKTVMLKGMLLLLLPWLKAAAQTSPIVWGEQVVISTGYAQGSKYGAEYGRMLPLGKGAWLAAYTVATNEGYRKVPDGGLSLEISRSDDNGHHWKKISSIADKGRDVDNAQLVQLHDGSILLACRSVRWQESYRLHVYRSTDGARSWQRLSTIDANEGKPGELGHPDKGMYEPHFYFLDDGRLSVMYANEKHVTDSVSYSQIISQKISNDGGRTWGPEIWVAYEPGHPLSRPGMPVWTKMRNGKYIVTYEICGPEKCNIYYKISDDGVTWPAGLGTQVPDQLGAPYILCLDDGRLLLTSNKSNISLSEDNGQTWRTVARAWEKTLWPAMYQTGKNEVCVMNGVDRPGGGHSVQIRLGRIAPLK